LTTADLGLASPQQWLGIGIVILLIGLVGGRIIPSFTLNWLKKRGESNLPACFGALDRGALGLAAATPAIWVVAPESPIGGAALIAAGGSSLVRLARWRGHLSLAKPLVWSLHPGFVWVSVGPPARGPQRILRGRAAGRGAARADCRRDGGHDPGGDDASHLGPHRAAADGKLVDRRPLPSRRRGSGPPDRCPILADAYLPLLWTSGLAWSTAFGLYVVHYGRMLLSR
jgi:uncharacterized protein involved in response to NO